MHIDWKSTEDKLLEGIYCCLHFPLHIKGYVCADVVPVQTLKFKRELGEFRLKIPSIINVLISWHIKLSFLDSQELGS